MTDANSIRVRKSSGTGDFVTIAVDSKHGTEYLHVKTEQLIEIIKQGQTYLSKSIGGTVKTGCDAEGRIADIENSLHLHLLGHSNAKINERLEALEQMFKEQKTVNTIIQTNVCDDQARLNKLESWIEPHQQNHNALFARFERNEEKINNLFRRIEQIEIHEIATENRLVNHFHAIGDIEGFERKPAMSKGYFGEKHEYKPRDKKGRFVKEVPGVNAPKVEIVKLRKGETAQ